MVLSRHGNVNRMPPTIELHIETLVIPGPWRTQREGLTSALQQELTELLSQGGVPLASLENWEIEKVRGGVIRLPSGSSRGVFGEQVARAIYEGLRDGHEGTSRNG
jgi:hypothetical protein